MNYLLRKKKLFNINNVSKLYCIKDKAIMVFSCLCFYLVVITVIKFRKLVNLLYIYIYIYHGLYFENISYKLWSQKVIN